VLGVVADGEQQPQFLREHLVVVVQADAEEAERFSEGAAPGDDLGAAVAEQVEGGAKSWWRRTGSAVDSTDTALVRRMRLVAWAIAASGTAGLATAKSGLWCSPRPKTSRPAWSAAMA
jgi:hypothetical protein